MPTVDIDGIGTSYSVVGSGPPLLLFAPGGFDATIDNWRSLGRYRDLRLLDHLSRQRTCIAFDRREAGRSGGRVERVGWQDYARQGKGLLDHLGFDRAAVMGGCVGCSIALRFALSWPQATERLVLFSPAGGARYRLTQHERFASHLAFVSERGLAAVVEGATGGADTFGTDPRLGPWAGAARRDPKVATALAGWDQGRYVAMVAAMARLLFDRDTVPGAEPEDLFGLDVPALVVPGQDRSHATSAARYLQECLPDCHYWDAPVAEQTQETTVPRLAGFLARP